MARISVVKRNEKRQKIVNQYWQKRQALKARISNPTSAQDQQSAIIAIQKLPRDSNKIRIRNRCLETGRARGVYSRFKLTRHMIRLYMSLGIIPGLQKSSW